MYRYLQEILPELAAQETRIITVLESKGGIDKGDYALWEMYCTDEDCDCRRVFLNVINIKNMQSVAVIAYGWENKKFYAKWYGFGKEENDPLINEMSGFSFASAPQSEYAPAMLEIVKNFFDGNKEFRNRIEKHYKAFKQKIDK